MFIDTAENGPFKAARLLRLGTCFSCTDSSSRSWPHRWLINSLHVLPKPSPMPLHSSLRTSLHAKRLQIERNFSEQKRYVKLKS